MVVWVSVWLEDAGGVTVTLGDETGGGLTTVVEGLSGVVTTSGCFSTVHPITITLASAVTKIAFNA